MNGNHERIAGLAFGAVLAVLLAALAPGCKSQQAQDTEAAAPAEPIIVTVGASMRKPMEQCLKAYQDAGNPAVKDNYGDSGDVLAQVKLSGQMAAAVLHEPYITQMKDQGLAVETHTLAYMAPVIVVAKGNPKGVKGLKDFLRDDLKVGMTDARYTTSGQLVQEALKSAGIQAQVMARHPVENRSSGYMVGQVELGALDMVTAWNAVAAGVPDKVESIAIESQWMPKTFTDADGMTYTDGRVAVGLVVLKTAPDVKAAQKLAAFILSPAGQAIWKANGFAPAAGE